VFNFSQQESSACLHISDCIHVTIAKISFRKFATLQQCFCNHRCGMNTTILGVCVSLILSVCCLNDPTPGHIAYMWTHRITKITKLSSGHGGWPVQCGYPDSTQDGRLCTEWGLSVFTGLANLVHATCGMFDIPTVSMALPVVQHNQRIMFNHRVLAYTHLWSREPRTCCLYGIWIVSNIFTQWESSWPLSWLSQIHKTLPGNARTFDF